MDKKGGVMIKKSFAFFILAIFIGCLSGCETIKGAAEGATKDWATLKKADNWLQKNLW